MSYRSPKRAVQFYWLSLRNGTCDNCVLRFQLFKKNNLLPMIMVCYFTFQTEYKIFFQLESASGSKFTSKYDVSIILQRPHVFGSEQHTGCHFYQQCADQMNSALGDKAFYWMTLATPNDWNDIRTVRLPFCFGLSNNVTDKILWQRQFKISLW